MNVVSAIYQTGSQQPVHVSCSWTNCYLYTVNITYEQNTISTEDSTYPQNVTYKLQKE